MYIHLSPQFEDLILNISFLNWFECYGSLINGLQKSDYKFVPILALVPT